MKEKKPPSKLPLLKPEDHKLWEHAMENVTHLKQGNKISPNTQKPFKYTSPVISGQISLETLMPPQFLPTSHPSSFQVDGALKKKFERGELEIDGKIDLHGLTLSEAHQKFLSFITRNIKRGARILLIITGKGDGDSKGVIRKNLPLWCEDQILKSHILKITLAQPKHGGTGAHYILLRRQK